MTDIGSTLREARMRLKIDISEVETRTKIRAKYLRAIENEEWDLLPGPVYVKSFLKTYSEYLGLDSRMLIDDYKRRYERPSDGEMRPIASISRERERAARGPLLPPWAIVAGALVVVAIVLGVIGSLGSGKSSNHNVASLHGNTGKSRARHGHRAAATKPAKVRPPAPASVKLKLTPTQLVYVCVTDTRGHQLIPGVEYNVGETVPVETRQKLLVTLGNAGVTMTVNGKSMPLPSTTSPISFELTPKGTHLLTGSQLPTCS